MPLSMDGLPGDSEIWSKIKAVVLASKDKMTVEKWMGVCESFSMIEGPNFHDQEFWEVLEKVLGDEVNEN